MQSCWQKARRMPTISAKHVTMFSVCNVGLCNRIHTANKCCRFYTNFVLTSCMASVSETYDASWETHETLVTFSIEPLTFNHDKCKKYQFKTRCMDDMMNLDN